MFFEAVKRRQKAMTLTVETRRQYYWLKVRHLDIRQRAAFILDCVGHDILVSSFAYPLTLKSEVTMFTGDFIGKVSLNVAERLLTSCSNNQRIWATGTWEFFNFFCNFSTFMKLFQNKN